MAEDQKHAIAEISESELQGVTTRNIKLHSKLRALELLIKRIGKGEGSRYLTVNIYQDGKLIESKTREIGSQ